MPLFGLGKSNILYWPGCYSSANIKNSVNRYKRILKKLGISFSTMENFACCAGTLINAGYDKEARKLARENFESLQKKGVKKIITNCPLCYKTFSQDYPDILPDWDIKSEQILVSVYNKIKQNPRIIKNAVGNQKIIYHDPCYLGRYSDIYEEPRKILELIGYELIELQNNKEEALCDGSCGNLKQLNPELANSIAKNYIKQLKNKDVKLIVTPDPQAFHHLKENLEGTGIQVIEFSRILAHALKIRE